MRSQPNTNVTFTPEHRRYPRRDVLFASAEFEKGIGGIVLNISEGGLALHATSQILSDELPDLRLQISVAEPWIETKGRIVWRSYSKRMVGVEFLDLAKISRQIIRNWISQTNDEMGLEGVSSAEDSSVSQTELPINGLGNAAESTVSLVGESHLSRMASTAPVPFERIAKAKASTHLEPYRQVYVAAGLLLLVIAGYLVLRSPSTPRYSNEVGNASAVPPTEKDVPNNSNFTPRSSSKAPIDRKSPSSEYGFVLQVAAIKSEKNAIGLADELGRRRFSVFISKSEKSDLFRVLVGPYGDVATAVQQQADLKRQGFSSIRQENKPSE